jgi:hypothetical protein
MTINVMKYKQHNTNHRHIIAQLATAASARRREFVPCDKHRQREARGITDDGVEKVPVEVRDV